VLGGPGVDQVEHRPGRLGRHEAQHFLQERVDDGMDTVVLEGVPVVLGLPYLDVAQSRLGAVGEVRDEARCILRADALPDAALDTVYASVGRKPQLVRFLIETAISGTGEAVPADQRDYVRAIQSAPDAETKIALYATAMRMIAGRLAPVLGILQQAAPAEPELAALWHEIAERRAANMRRLWPTSEKVRFRIRSGHAGSLPPRTDSPRTAGHRDEIRLRGGGGRC
jgi:hypothetical protein